MNLDDIIIIVTTIVALAGTIISIWSIFNTIKRRSYHDKQDR